MILQDALELLRIEYLDMPGLSLTSGQADPPAFGDPEN